MMNPHSARKSGAFQWIWGAGISLFVIPALVCAVLCLEGAPRSALAQGADAELESGLSIHRSGDYKKAVEAYTVFLKKNPLSAEAYNWRGMAFDELNEHDKAVVDYTKAIEINPNYADAYNNRGEAYRKKKLYPQAIADYRKALQIDQNYVEAIFNIGLILEAQKKAPEAVRQFDEYLKKAPTAADKQQVLDKIKALRATAPPPRQAPTGPPGAAPLAPPGPGAPPPLGPPGAFKPPTPPQPGAIPGLPAELPIPKEALALIAGLGLIALAIPLVVYLFFAVMLFLMANKTNTPMPWLAFIPLANLFLMVQIAGKPIWWLALLLAGFLAPVFGLLATIDPTGGIIVTVLTALAGLVSFVAALFIWMGIAAARGKGIVWGILAWLPCTSPIGVGYLGLSK